MSQHCVLESARESICWMIPGREHNQRKMKNCSTTQVWSHLKYIFEESEGFEMLFLTSIKADPASVTNAVHILRDANCHGDVVSLTSSEGMSMRLEGALLV